MVRKRTYYEDTKDKQAVQSTYSTSRCLDTKYDVMQRYGVAEESFEDWVLDRIGVRDNESVLDVGCGQGRFLLPIARRMRDSSGNVTGCDLSAGVMSELRALVQGEDLPVELLVGDIEDLPFDDETFDLVMANHMLYHVPSIPRALSEVRRVLRPAGRFIATTNAQPGMRELHDLHVDTMRELEIPYTPTTSEDWFSLDNGRGVLEDAFGSVAAHRYEGGFEVTDAQPVLDYYKATQLFQGPVNDQALSMEQRRAIEPTFKRLTNAAIARAGGKLLISKPMGVFVCTNDRR